MGHFSIKSGRLEQHEAALATAARDSNALEPLAGGADIYDVRGELPQTVLRLAGRKGLGVLAWVTRLL